MPASSGIASEESGRPRRSFKRFFKEIDVKSLAIYVDKTIRAGFDLGVVGVPTTLLIDRSGREIGRVAGPA